MILKEAMVDDFRHT